MKKIFLPLTFLLPVITFAQQMDKDKQNIKVVTNTEPSYPKGDNELYTYVLYNVKYTDESKKMYIEGEVTLSFDVKTDSTITNILIISGVGHGVDEEVKKTVQTLKFIPGIQNGIPIKMNAIYSFPIKAH